MQRVILCLVRPAEGEEARVNTETLVGLFRRFGRLTDVRIFERRVLIKAFIEYEDPSAAMEALQKVRDRGGIFCESLKVFPAKKKRIMRTDSLPFTEDLSQGLVDKLEARQDRQASGRPPFPPNISAITQLPSSNAFQSPPFPSTAHPAPATPLPSTSLQTWLSGLSQHHPSLTGFSSDEVGQPPPRPFQLFSNPSHPLPYRVAMVNRLVTDRITHEHLAALFSCYGQVVKILINATLNFALIEFATAEDAYVAASCLKTIRLFGCLLKTKLSKYQTLSFRSLEKESNCALKYFYLDPAVWTSKSALTAKPEAPRTALAVHHCPPDFSPALLHLLVAQTHEPVLVTLHPQPAPAPPIFLVELSFLDQAVDVLAKLDRLKVNDRALAVTFAPEVLPVRTPNGKPSH